MSYFDEENEYKCTLLELFMQNWVDKLLSVVFDLYSNAMVEERHGFNKTSIGFFITDMVKTECLTYAFAGPIVPAIIWIVRAGGEIFNLYLRDAVGARSAKRHHLQWHDRRLQVLVAQGSAAS